MIPNPPPAVPPGAARRGVPAPPVPARPANPALDRLALQVAGLITGWLMLNIVMAITEFDWMLP